VELHPTRSRQEQCFTKIPFYSQYNDKYLRKIIQSRALAEKFSGGPTEKRPKNTTIKPLSAISVLCIKIQGVGHDPAPDAYEYNIYHRERA